MATAFACLAYLAGLAAITTGVCLVSLWVGLIVGGSLVSVSALAVIVVLRIRSSFAGGRVAP